MNPTIIRLAVTAILCALSWWGGWEWRDRSADVTIAERDRDDAKAGEQAVTQTLKTDRKSQADTAPIAQQAEQRAAERDQNFDTITRDVIRYVTTYVPDPACRRDPAGDAEFVRLWNAAARGQAAAAPAAEPVRPQ